jgi:microcin C transport system substrate-binding protein
LAQRQEFSLHARRLAILSLIVGCAQLAHAEGPPPWRHGAALLGTPKYEAGFTHFDYVNPAAPKGGIVRLGVLGTFDSFNTVVSGVKGQLEERTNLIYDTLMAPALDEIGTDYGLIAEALRYPDDHSSVTYRLRAEPRWHDGTPVTADDVVYSFEALKAHSPLFSTYWRNVQKAEKTGEREVTFTFTQSGNRELPQIIGLLPVLPKHWWQGTDASGRKRNITETTLEPPLGSGPYRIRSFEAGRGAVYERVADYWGRDLPVNRGQYNFAEIRTEYYRDSNVLLEAFKADRLDFRLEGNAKEWATAYNFPSRRDGRVVLEEFPIKGQGGMQFFALNLRRDKFKDERVRRALDLAFDFESINRNLFFGHYQRTDSFFYGTELAARGLPEGLEKDILESVRDKVPPDVFTTPYKNPVNDTAEAVRNNLREAVRLLGEAGYEVKGSNLVSKATGAPLTIEYLGYDANSERFLVPYEATLKRIGISMSVRIVDATQYQNRLSTFDFDMTTNVVTQSLTPGNEQRDFFGSAAADRDGSFNLSGIKDAGVDALIERVIYARDRAELVAATRALDRVLLAHHYVVPHWTHPFERTARWDRFGRPAELPKYSQPAFPSIWWYDTAKAEKVRVP